MHFLFMKDLFSQYETDLRIENGIETIHIRNTQFDDEIVIHYYPDDYYTYLFQFATQHRDTSSKEDLIKCALSFANGEKAAIEFFEDGNRRFGGEMEVSLLDHLTYDELQNHFGYPHLDLTNLTFRVRAWNARYCFDGYFEKSQYGTINIARKYARL